MSHLEFPLLMFYSSQCVFHFLGQVYSKVFYFGGGGRGRGCDFKRLVFFFPSFPLWYFLCKEMQSISCCCAEFISSSSFCVTSLVFSIYSIVLSAYNDNFISSIPIWISFVSFPYLIAVASTANTIKEEVRVGILIFFQILRGTLSAFHQLISCCLWVCHKWVPQVALMVKNPPANAEDIRDMGSIPGGGHGNPLQYSCLENSMDRGAWWATVHGITESQTGLSD